MLAPLLLVEAGLRLLVARRRPGFEQELARVSHAGQREEILAFIQRQHLLRFAAPTGYLQGKLGAVYRQFGEHRRAAGAFRQALEETSGAAAYPLALGLADSLFELGELAEAERVYRSALDEEHAPPRACVHLAQLIRRRGGSLEEAEALLRRAVEQQPDLRWQCELTSLLIERGKTDEADWQLKLCEEALASSGAADDEARAQLGKLRAELEQARLDPAPQPAPAPARQGFR